jgi:hypothetical protein
MAISAGTDTYGRVKAVCGTPIVTKFAMLQFLPVFPLQSFYFLGAGATETTGIPLLASSQSAVIYGIPLASVDTTSVFMAYARGVFGALAVCGFIVIVPGIMYLTGENLDDFAILATRGLLIALIVGIVGGLLTYAIPVTPRREREIRQYCAEVLGVSADPARVQADWGVMIEEFVNQSSWPQGDPRIQLLRELVFTRAKIAKAIDPVRMELKTDELLEELRRAV